MALQGTYTAMITPFANDGSIDWSKLKDIIKFQLDSGVNGLVPCGTTGESPTLNHQEHEEVIAKTVEIAKSIKSDIVIIAGTGSNSTSEAITMTQAAAKNGADYALVVNPYYNKPTQGGLISHFKAVADASDIPLVLYNIPGRTAVKLSLETIIELSKHQNIVAIKEATGDINFMTQIIQNTADDFDLLSGDDNLILPILAVGGKGAVSVLSNVFPSEVSQVSSLFFDDKFTEAQKAFMKIFPLCQKMFLETNPIPVKYAASVIGLCENNLRLPMTPLAQEHHKAIADSVAELKG